MRQVRVLVMEHIACSPNRTVKLFMRSYSVVGYTKISKARLTKTEVWDYFGNQRAQDEKRYIEKDGRTILVMNQVVNNGVGVLVLHRFEQILGLHRLDQSATWKQYQSLRTPWFSGITENRCIPIHLLLNHHYWVISAVEHGYQLTQSASHTERMYNRMEPASHNQKIDPKPYRQSHFFEILGIVIRCLSHELVMHKGIAFMEWVYVRTTSLFLSLVLTISI